MASCGGRAIVAIAPNGGTKNPRPFQAGSVSLRHLTQRDTRTGTFVKCGNKTDRPLEAAYAVAPMSGSDIMFPNSLMIGQTEVVQICRTYELGVYWLYKIGATQ